MSEVIFDAFEKLVHMRKGYTARGFWNIDCPACGDRRQRGGFAPTKTGGFRYYCQNGGCPFHDKPTGWEPGNGLRGRVADLFKILGGDIRSLPMEEVMKVRPREDQAQAQNRDVKLSFPEMALPPASMRLIDALETDPRSHPVGEWLIRKRSEVYLYPEYQKYLWWSPTSPKKLRIAFVHYDRVVGYLDRDITKTEGADRFMQRSPENYLFGQHRVSELPGDYVIVVESPMDAILLNGVATRSSRPTQTQINFLLQCGKTPIWVPDLKDAEGMKFIETAERYNHPICVPEWPYKDPGEAFIPLGVLNTAHLILAQKTNIYRDAKMKIEMRTKMLGR